MRRGGLRHISPTCQNYYAERDLAPSKVRGRTNTRMNLIAVTAKTAKTKRSPYSRRLSSTKLYSRPSRKKSAQSNAMTVLNTARRPLYSAAIKVLAAERRSGELERPSRSRRESARRLQNVNYVNRLVISCSRHNRRQSGLPSYPLSVRSPLCRAFPEWAPRRSTICLL